jgi:tetratricopeptide (TPR) repeat protein
MRRAAEVRPDPLAAGTDVGRYRIIDLLRTGAAGSVYRAHDPELRRDVALQVMLPRPSVGAPDEQRVPRLLREGQALARLSHPNVAAAYDVGLHGDSVFVALELVQGRALPDWLKTKPRRTELLGVLIAAGHGLMAAHAAGVVHGGLRPEHVVVGSDGRVCIVDFGLAGSLATPGQTELDAAGSVPDRAAAELGHAPAVDTQADRDGFAATVVFAFTGHLPEPAGRTSERGSLHRRRRPGGFSAIPARIRSILERTRVEAPERRHPTLLALVAALERTRAPRPRAVLIGLALALLAVSIASVVVVARSSATRVACKVDAASFAGVWDAARRAELERALSSTGRVNAGEAFSLLAARLDGFQTAWQTMKQESCQATHVRGEQSEQVLGLRNTCLERKLRGLEALVNAFSAADARAVDRAAGALPDSIRECADAATLLGVADRLPADPGAREVVQRLVSGFAITKALMTAGRDARDQARGLLEEARASGHAPTVAQATTWYARAISTSARSAEERAQAEALLREGMHLAAQIGDDRLLAKTASFLFAIISYGQRRIQEAEAMLPMVDAFVSRAGNDAEQRVELSMGEAVILAERGKYDDAIEAFEQVIALSPDVESDLRGYGAYAQGQIGEICLRLHRYPEAVQHIGAELDGIQRELGARHPRVIFSLTNLGLAQAKAGLRDSAWATAARLRELVSSVIAPGDWRTVTVTYLEANIWESAGDCSRALPLYREAFERVVTTYGPNDANTADVHARLGSCLRATGQGAAAVAELERALAIRRALGGAPNTIAEATFELADALWSAGAASQRERALLLGEEALSTWRQDDVSGQVAVAERWLAARAAPGDGSRAGDVPAGGPKASRQAGAASARAIWPNASRP